MGITLDEYTHLCSELVTISVPGTSSTTVGNLEEIGEWKARVLADRALSVGTTVSLSAGEHCLNGTICGWSYEPVMGYFLDVRLNRESRWSANRFRPQHLLCIADLIGEIGVAAA